MPLLNDFIPIPSEYVLAAITDDGRNVADVRAAAATIDETSFFLQVAAALYGWDGADLSRVLVESAASPNLRAAIYDGTAGPADVAAAAATLDETAATFLKGMVALYGFDDTTGLLQRLLSYGNNVDNIVAVAAGILGTNAFNYGYDGAAWDRILAVAGAMVVTGPYEDEDAWTFGTSRVFPIGAVADDAAVDSLAEDQVGIPRMTLTRVLNAVLSDPTTVTQRQRVLTAAATADETAAQWATVAAVLYGHDTAAAGGSQLVKVEVQSTASPNLRSALYDGDVGPADIAAAGASLDETAATFLKGMVALYARDPAAGGGSQLVRASVESTAQPNLRVGIYEAGDEAGVSSASSNLSETATTWLQVVASLSAFDPNGGVGSSIIPIHAVPAGTDALANTNNAVTAAGQQYLFEPVLGEWNRARNNHEVTALASAARVATTPSAALVNYNARGCAILLDVTAVGAPAGQINSIEIQAQLPGAIWRTIYQFAAINLAAIGQRAYLIYPGAASPGSWDSQPMQGNVPRNFRVQATHNDANSITYSLTLSMLN